MEMNLLDYLPLTPEEIQEAKLEYSAILTLLNPDEAQYLARPFEVGTNKILLYGQPIAMKANSEVIFSIADFKHTVPIATSITLTETNTPTFLYIWFYMNGLINEYIRPGILGKFELLDLLLIVEWCAYFGIDQEKFVSLERDIESQVKYLKPEGITDDVKLLLGKLIKPKFNACLEVGNSEAGRAACAKLMPYVNVLTSNEQAEIFLATLFHSNLGQFEGHLYNTRNKRLLSDVEAKWAKKGYDYLVQLTSEVDPIVSQIYTGMKNRLGNLIK